MHNKQNQYSLNGFSSIRVLNKGIWLYFFLLIFEGALRKWIFPSLASPLLIIRDPIGIYLLYKAFTQNLVVHKVYIYMCFFIGVVSFFTAILFGHENFNVAVFGLRVFVIHLPLIFIIANSFTRQDVIRMGVVLLYISLPMTLLLAIQFFSPQSAWVNRGVGGDMAGSGFGGALGYFRSSCTFSFTNGTALFYGLLACFVLFFWLSVEQKKVNKILLLASTFALIIAIPLSISRTLLFEVVLSLGFSLMVLLKRPKLLGRVLVIVLSVGVFYVLVSQISFFSTAMQVFTARFTDANDNEKGLGGVIGTRFLGSFVRGISNALDVPFWGYGLGMGSNVGAALLKGKREFLIAEEEWSRIVGEMGILLGLMFIYWRVKLGFDLLLNSFKHLNKGNILPWLLCSFGIVNVIQGQLAQPTSMGFSILIGGLIISSFKNESYE